MGIRFNCPNGHKLNVKDYQAGRKGVCPVCGVKMQIPWESTRPSSHEDESHLQGGGAASTVAAPEAAPQPIFTPAPAGGEVGVVEPAAFSGVPAPPAPPLPAAPGAPADPLGEAGNVVWYVRPPSGGQYGPATADIMRTWLAEGRITADALVWREGWRDWQQAGGTFPQLSAGPTVPGLESIVSAPVAASVPARPPKRRALTRSTQAMVLGGLVLTVVVLFVILLAILMNQ